MTDRRPAHELLDLANRWGIAFDEDEAFDHFKHRFIVALDQYTRWGKEDERFVLSRLAIIRGYSTSAKDLAGVLGGMGDLSNFLFTAQLVIWAIRDADAAAGYTISRLPFTAALIEARDHSPMIDFLVVDTDGGPTILPAGARELDVPLVAKVLTWLRPHTKVAATFEKALRTVLAKDSAGYRGALDDLRWSLEQLLRVVLENERPIEDQKVHVSKWLKERGAHQSVIQLFVDLQKHFADYQNDAVKHDEKWSEDEIEFMIYLTGSFMRLLLRLSEK